MPFEKDDPRTFFRTGDGSRQPGKPASDYGDFIHAPWTQPILKT
ncbi:hypothetical protein [Acrocarpospora corrugata]|nr:hypothetical protein [Acrocarpospora corrugata]